MLILKLQIGFLLNRLVKIIAQILLSIKILINRICKFKEVVVPKNSLYQIISHSNNIKLVIVNHNNSLNRILKPNPLYKISSLIMELIVYKDT